MKIPSLASVSLNRTFCITVTHRFNCEGYISFLSESYWRNLPEIEPRKGKYFSERLELNYLNWTYAITPWYPYTHFFLQRKAHFLSGNSEALVTGGGFLRSVFKYVSMKNFSLKNIYWSYYTNLTCSLTHISRL